MNGKHRYSICRKCHNPLKCSLCGKTPYQIYNQRIAELEATIAEQQKVIDAQEAYIRMPFTREASHMAAAKKNLATLLEEK